MDMTRLNWTRVLTAHPAEALIKVAHEISQDWILAHAELPQAGLGMLKLADGAFHEPYYLGEFPLARCHVRLTLPDGRSAEGAAQVLADDAKLAEALAVLDAVLSAQLPGWEEAAAWVETGAEKREEEQRERRAVLAATRVDFSLLGTTEDGDED